MAISVRIPAQIKRLYGTDSWEMVEAETVAQAVAALDARYPGIGERLLEPDGQMRRWVNVFVEGKDIRILQGVDSPLKAGMKVHIVPSVAGG